MIFFCCPECREELEAEDAIKGTAMKCPACWKEISVPVVGMRAPSTGGRKEKPQRVVASGGGMGGLFLLVAVSVVVGLAALFGIGYLLRGKNTGPLTGPPCTVCAGKGTQPCKSCAGAATQACTNVNCKGGKTTNVQGGEENCSTCAGKGTIPCQICGGAGGLSCTHCYGLKFEGAKPPPTYDTGKDPKHY